MIGISRLAQVHGYGPMQTAERLRIAYAAVFTEGRASEEDIDIVLVDLAAKSGFFMFSPEDTPAESLRHREGKREMFAHLIGHLTLDASALRDLQAAARHEAALMANS